MVITAEQVSIHLVAHKKAIDTVELSWDSFSKNCCSFNFEVKLSSPDLVARACIGSG